MSLPGFEELESAHVDHEALVSLLRERRYEEALELLYRERELHPDDAAITRSIRHLKEHLTMRYGRELGSFDAVPVAVVPEEMRAKLSMQDRHVLRLIDGLATYGDIVVGSQLGRYETCRALTLLLRRGAVVTRKPSGMHPAVRPPEPEPPPTRRSHRPEPAPASSTEERHTPEPPTPVIPQPPTRGAAAEPRPHLAASSPQPNTRDSAPPSSLAALSTGRAARPEPDPYAALFRGATEAYMRRDYDAAQRIFEECSRQRPSDQRAAYNLRKLRERR